MEAAVADSSTGKKWLHLQPLIYHFERYLVRDAVVAVVDLPG